MSSHTVEQIQLKLEQVTSLLKSQHKSICTAESCTGGMLSMWLTDLAGSSEWFDCGVVSYTNQSKSAILAVEPHLIEEHGAVSEPVALAMAKGALARSQADIAVAITGIAGPTGGSAKKPVGTVCFAVAAKHQSVVVTKQFDSQDRHSIRSQSCLTALSMVEQFIA